MTQEDLAELARATEELRLKQETPDPPEALKSVPSLSLEDIPKKPTYVPTEVMITQLMVKLIIFICITFLTHY